ncbi:RNA polymerase sigma factor [Actinotalea subterranea]|uniref:RNA polymerase sigma factor n=1 Tax=Actinotalea subterranea TaxID=2607497 RepID=UPI0011EDB699|nr:sigma-70 family RNA polymerase sigma factor [Actinotalea subterranea]
MAHPGDQVLAELARERGGDLTAYAYLLTGDVAAAQDLVQDAFVKVFGRLRTGFTPEVAEAYVRRTILTLYVDDFRRRRRWTAVTHLVARAETTSVDSADALDLRTALGGLTPQERACVVLRYYEDLPVAEVAQRMNLATGTVKRYLSNAVHRLEALIGQPMARLDESLPVTPSPASTPGAVPAGSRPAAPHRPHAPRAAVAHTPTARTTVPRS